jgi:hypothetical protein
MIPRFILTEKSDLNKKSMGTCPECTSYIGTNEKEKHTICDVCGTKLLNVQWSTFIMMSLVVLLAFMYCVISIVSE